MIIMPSNCIKLYVYYLLLPCVAMTINVYKIRNFDVKEDDKLD